MGKNEDESGFAVGNQDPDRRGLGKRPERDEGPSEDRSKRPPRGTVTQGDVEGHDGRK